MERCRKQIVQGLSAPEEFSCLCLPYEIGALAEWGVPLPALLYFMLLSRM